MKFLLLYFLNIVVLFLFATVTHAQSFCTQIAINDQLPAVENTKSLTFSLASLLGNDTEVKALESFTQPTSGTLTYNTATKMFTYTPEAGSSGMVTFNYTLKKETRLGTPFIINGEEHYYEQVLTFNSDSKGSSWLESKMLAEASSYNGMKGYLVTVTSAAENAYIRQKLFDRKLSLIIWLGASDAEEEGVWKWVTGPEAGMQFTQQVAGQTGVPVNGMYQNWNVGEPNNSGGIEDYAIYRPIQDIWNDLKQSEKFVSYMVEYGSSQNCSGALTATVSLTVNGPIPNEGNGCNLALTTTTMQAEPWWPMWGVLNGAGSIDLTVTGGTAPYSYQWNSGITTQDISAASPGLYTVTVTDAAGCSAMTNVYVGHKNNPLILTSSHIDATMGGGMDGSVDLSVIGGTGPYTFMWSNGATTEDLTGVMASTYSVTVMDAMGKKAMTSVMVGERGMPLTLSIAHQNVMRAGGYGSIDLSIMGGVAPYSVLWNAGSRNEDLPQVTPGMYTVTVTDAVGASATASVNVVGFGMPAIASRKGESGREVSLNPVKEAGLVAYPNPATDRATISFNLAETGNYTLDLFDIRGAKVKTIASGKGQSDQQLSVELNAPAQAKGVYLIRLVSDKQVITKRIMFKQ
ncbi:MAG: T9SS type A sorting domain-containing protein [Adhaeribacter sp.]